MPPRELIEIKGTLTTETEDEKYKSVFVQVSPAHRLFADAVGNLYYGEDRGKGTEKNVYYSKEKKFRICSDFEAFNNRLLLGEDDLYDAVSFLRRLLENEKGWDTPYQKVA